MSKLRWVGLGLGVLAVCLLAGAQSGSDRPGGYHVGQSVTLPGGGGWDYLGIDVPGRRIYVSASTEEDVVNADTFQVVGKVEGLKGTHGVAISGKDGHGFTSNGGGNSMTEFDLKTLATIKEIPLPIQRPDGIIYDPATDRVFAYNNMEDSSVEIEIDAKTLKITHQWPLAPCEGPSGLAMDTQTRRLFIGCHNGMMAMMNADTGAIVATVPIGPGVDANRFDEGTKLAFISNGGGTGTITVAHEDSPGKLTLVGNIPTEAGARTMELDPKTHTLFTVTAKFEPAPPRPAGEAAPAGRGRGPRRQMVAGSFHLLVIPNH